MESPAFCRLLKSPGIEDLRDSARQIWCASFSLEQSTCLLANSLWLSNSVDYKQPVLDTLAENYFADREMTQVKMNWSSTSNLFYINWLNYYVYQVTPFKL